ncbi:hypothetical protein Tco_1419300 [Tanacetum coccineum]
MESVKTSRRTTKASSFNIVTFVFLLSSAGLNGNPGTFGGTLLLSANQETYIITLLCSSGSSAGKIQEPPSFISDEDAFASADQQTDILQPLRERFC